MYYRKLNYAVYNAFNSWIFLFKPVSIASHIVMVSATKALQINNR